MMNIDFGKVDLSSPKPLYIQISEIIEKKIVNKEIQPGQKLPNQEDLHKIFNVSLNTIKEAISCLVDSGYVASRPTHGTIVISSEPIRKNTIGVIFCTANKNIASFAQMLSYYPRLYMNLAGIEEKLSGNDSCILNKIFYNGSGPSFEKILESHTGLIISGSITENILDILKKTRLPFVFIGDVIGSSFTNGCYDVIVESGFQSIYILTKYLIDLGHKRIAYIVGNIKRHSYIIKQLEGYKRALEEANIEFDNDLIMETEEVDAVDAYFVMKGFLKKSISFSALINFNQNIGEGAMRALREANMKIPEDVSIGCIGASDRFTTTDYDLVELGRLAVTRLFERIKNPDIKTDRIEVQPTLIVRNSCMKIK